jgi:hypothetical protein
MYIAGVLPAAIYGAEHEPWGDKDSNRMVRHAVTALQLRSPGILYVLAELTLPAVADPRFKMLFAAIERWSTEIWENAHADGTGSQGH